MIQLNETVERIIEFAIKEEDIDAFVNLCQDCELYAMLSNYDNLSSEDEGSQWRIIFSNTVCK